MTSLPEPTTRYQLDLVRYQLLRDGRDLKLERQPMELLIFLVKRKGELVGRHEIAAKLWGADVFVDAEHSINRIIRKLRVALNDDSDRPQFLETVVGKGYRFVGPIEIVTRPEPAAPPRAAVVPPTRAFRVGWPAVVSAAFIALAIVAAVIWQLRGESAAAGRIRVIAVLPFQDLSADGAQEYFADGMTDELTTDLAKIGSLTVIARTSTMKYRNTRETVDQIGRELNADGLIEGSVVHAGGKVRITAQLIDAKSQRHLWADSYERDFEDVLGVQNAVALEVARQVRVTLTSAEQGRLGRQRSVNSEAYDAYLKGRYLLTSQTAEGLQEAQAAFQQAIALDPTYASAYSGLADSFSLLANYGALAPRVAFPQAEAAAIRSLELDASLSEAHAALGFAKHHYDWDWARAEQEYKAALQLNPSATTAHLRYAEYLSTVGRHDEAVAEIKRAVTLDPLSPLLASNVGRLLYYARRYDEAIDVLKRNLASDPSRVYSRIHLARCYEQKSMYAESLAEFEKTRVFFKNSHSVGLAHLYAVSGQPTKAKDMLRELQATARDSDWLFVAGIDAALGETDNAFISLDKAYALHDFFLPFIKVEPIMDPIRGDPRYANLLRRLGMN